MSKYRHRTFEMFDFSDEAAAALASKSTRTVEDSIDPESWSLQHLVASRSAGVVHLRFKESEGLGSEFSSGLRKDLSLLADLLVNDSRVLLDFESLHEFCPRCVDELELFNARLRSKGSRMSLCKLEPAVRAAFFPNRSGSEPSSKAVGS